MVINGLIILLLCQFLGELVVTGLNLPLPGTIMGMLILLLGLMLWQPLRNTVEPAAAVLIKHLTLLFFPIGVGLVLEWPRFSEYGAALIVSLVLGTLIAIPAVALVLNRLINKP